VDTFFGFGVVGTGQIAGEFAVALGASRRCRVVNVAGSSLGKARAFAAHFGVDRAAADLTELLNDPAVQAVYVATPHPWHEAHARAALEAGRAVLCEKPLTLDAAGTARLIALAERHGVFLMEAFMYRSHPLLAALIERVLSGAIGLPRHLRSVFGYRAPHDAKSRIFERAAGGGGVLDVGGYPVSLARLCAGLARGLPFDEPLRVVGSGHVGVTGVDELAFAELAFDGGFSAEIACATRHALGTESVLFGEEGRIVVPDVWLPEGGRQGLTSSFRIERDDREPELVRVTSKLSTFAIEAEVVADSLPRLEPAWPAMSHADSLGNARVLDAWLAEVHAPR
jgi:predicted dehydrogenase